MKTEQIDYYHVLGVSQTASGDEIHSAYRILARRYHPDLNPNPRAATSMALVNEAFAILSDAGRRAEYDSARKGGAPAELDSYVIDAAHSMLLKSGWKVAEFVGNDLVLGSGKRQMFVRLLARLNELELHSWLQDTERLGRRKPLGLSVMLASRVGVRAEQIPRTTPVNRIPLIVVDLTQAERSGNDFPDSQYKTPFEPFLRNSRGSTL